MLNKNESSEKCNTIGNGSLLQLITGDHHVKDYTHEKLEIST